MTDAKQLLFEIQQGLHQITGSDHQHGPYIVTEWEYEEQYIYHEGTGQSSIIPGTCKAITYRCSICLEPREENKQ